MRRLFKPCKIFLSHKNIDGKAAYSTVLLKDKLDKKLFFHVFFDKHEKEMEEFPSYIKEAIFNSDVYILKIPDNGNVDFLLDESNWVHKEIKYALVQKVINPKYKIIPVSFNSKFLWDSSGVKLDKDIEKIKDYNICYVDSDERNFESKIYDRIGYPLKNVVNTKLLLTIVAILLMISACVGNFWYDSYKRRKSIEDVSVIQSVISDEYENFKGYEMSDIEKYPSLNSLYLSIDSLFIMANSLKPPRHKISDDYISMKASREFCVTLYNFFSLADRVNSSLKSMRRSTYLLFRISLVLTSKDSLALNELDANNRDLNKIDEELDLSIINLKGQMQAIATKVDQYSKKNNMSGKYEAAYFYHNAVLWKDIELVLVRSVAYFEFVHDYTRKTTEILQD